MADLDKEAAAIIIAAKKKRTADGLIPPPPATLAELEKRRRLIVTDGIASLTAELGSTIASTIDGYVRKPASTTSSIAISQ